MRPGVEVISRAQPLPRSAPTDTGVSFLVGATEKGVNVKLVRSLTEYENEFGQRQTGAAAYDAADVYFREGGSMLYVSRTNGTSQPAARGPAQSDLEGLSRAELDDLATSKDLDPSEYGTKAEMIDALAALLPPNGATKAADTGIVGALDALSKTYGPGQIFIADPALAAVADNQTALLDHAYATNRVALLTTTDGDASSLQAAATALHASANGRYGALFAPSAVVPGIAVGTTRTVPYSAVQAGIIARNDVRYNPNIAAAGDLGQAVFATDLTMTYSDADYEALNIVSCNMARLVYGGVRTYGYRSAVDEDTPLGRQWLDFGWSRLNMGIVARAEEIGEHYVFSQLDGRRRTISQFGGELAAMLVPFYEAGALYGATADEAFAVDVGQSINTEETIANGELRAVITVRMSPFAEWVVIEVVKVATTQAIAA